MAVAGEFRCLDSAIASVIEDVERAFILKEEQGTVIKAFVDSIESRGIFCPFVCPKAPVLCVCEHSGWFLNRSALYFRLHMANRPSHCILNMLRKNKSMAFDVSTLFVSKDSFKTVFLNNIEAPTS